MKLLKKMSILLASIFIVSIPYSEAGFFDDFIGGGTPTVRYCDSGDCGLDEGITEIRDGINDIETTRTASQYIQDIVVYLLSFLSLVAVLYIIYAGFRILVSAGDEEAVKKSKQTIIYVIIGLIVIWLAWSITIFVLNILTT